MVCYDSHEGIDGMIGARPMKPIGLSRKEEPVDGGDDLL